MRMAGIYFHQKHWDGFETGIGCSFQKAELKPTPAVMWSSSRCVPASSEWEGRYLHVSRSERPAWQRDCRANQISGDKPLNSGSEAHKRRKTMHTEVAQSIDADEPTLIHPKLMGKGIVNEDMKSWRKWSQETKDTGYASNGMAITRGNMQKQHFLSNVSVSASCRRPLHWEILQADGQWKHRILFLQHPPPNFIWYSLYL